MKLIDSHNHLDQIENVDEALAQASQAGVDMVIAVGVHLQANRKNLEIQQRISSPKIHLAFGIHPGEIKPEEIEETLQFIRDHHAQAIAIGEIGLDFWYRWVRKDDEKKQQQREVFRRQLELAKEFNLPVVIHSRGAWKDCLQFVLDFDIKKVLFHWYSGPVDVLNQILEKGFWISVTPSLAYSPEHRAAAVHAPIEQTLIETDSPVYFKEGLNGGFQAGPKDVAQTLKLYAAVKEKNEEELSLKLYQNAKNFFGV